MVTFTTYVFIMFFFMCNTYKKASTMYIHVSVSTKYLTYTFPGEITIPYTIKNKKQLDKHST